MNQDFSIFTLVTQASLIVQLVMAGLMVASLASWTVIFTKLFGLARIRAANATFEQEFWAGKQINELYAQAVARVDGSPMQRVGLTPTIPLPFIAKMRPSPSKPMSTSCTATGPTRLSR